MKRRASAARCRISAPSLAVARCRTVLPEVVDVEANVSLPLLRQPAEIEEPFASGDADVGRRRCEAVRDGVIDSA